MNCSLEQINRAIERMSKLDTSPGLRVGHHENHPITADVIVEPDEEDGYTVSLIDTRLPNLRVNDFYQKMTRNRDIDDKTRQFLQKNIHSAQWFMDAIQQRKRTLLRVARAIVKHQKGFFDKGKAAFAAAADVGRLPMKWVYIWRRFHGLFPGNMYSVRKGFFRFAVSLAEAWKTRPVPSTVGIRLRRNFRKSSIMRINPNPSVTMHFAKNSPKPAWGRLPAERWPNTAKS